jgi:Fe-S-cluster-containing dehydrogenase component
MPPVTNVPTQQPEQQPDQFDIPARYNPAGLKRREFLALMGASMAMAGLSGCRNKMPLEPIFPYALRENEIAGRPRFFTTTFPLPGFVQGLLVESHDGHPTKIEGNPLHPSSLGSTCLYAQASVIDLYSPSRLKNVTGPSLIAPDLSSVRLALQTALLPIREAHGRGLAILSGNVNSPTLARQRRELMQMLPEASWYEAEPISNQNRTIGLVPELGYAATPKIDLNRVRCLLTLDCDFLGIEPDTVSFPQIFMDRRRSAGDRTRLYAVDCGITNTGAKADHHWRMAPTELEHFTSRLELALESKSLPEGDEKFRALIDDLKSHAGVSLILGGFSLSPSLHARIHRLNRRLGNIGSTLAYRELDAFSARGIHELAVDLESNKVKALIVLGGDPVYDSPASLGLASSIKKVAFSAHLASFPSETSTATQWTIPEAHFLEMWSDAVSSEGSFSLVQPLLATRDCATSAHDVLNWIAGKSESAYETVRATWRGHRDSSAFEESWRQALANGICPSEFTPARSTPNRKKRGPSDGTASVPTKENTTSPLGLEIAFRPDATIWDGRFSENPWLQELPKPPSGLCWDNALLIAPATAAKHGLATGDIATVKTSSGSADSAVLVHAGMPENLVSLSLGYGKKQAGELGQGIGFSANPLRRRFDEWSAPVLAIQKTGQRYELAITNAEHDMGGRDLIRSMTLEQAKGPFQSAADLKTEIGLGTLGPNIPPAMTDKKQQWAMSIDLDSCIGCSVCVVACQAENNIPIVGKKMTLMGRQMHWIRIDRYASPQSAGELAPLPVTCMHCETAPCEVVCPVGATNHSSTGLNQMVYNRCVGTRYCSNNCPYKVRRFNFFKFADNVTGASTAQRNPEVTVRARGVMEKCTYCVQRIERVRIDARKEDREILDGEIRTACQQACPTSAITFGNLLDPKSRVVANRKSARTYGLLTELGTRPRTTYLAMVTHPHPSVEAKR